MGSLSTIGGASCGVKEEGKQDSGQVWLFKWLVVNLWGEKDGFWCY